jgi:membrane-bound metal-dependent hydrolase YbcI (DUF457 family)
VDSISHAFAISALMMAGGQPALIAPGILGAVIPDLDIVLSRIGDRRPDLYILTHGGITHSLAGGILLSTAIYTGATAFSVGLGLRGPLAAVPFPAGISSPTRAFPSSIPTPTGNIPPGSLPDRAHFFSGPVRPSSS